MTYGIAALAAGVALLAALIFLALLRRTLDRHTRAIEHIVVRHEALVGEQEELVRRQDERLAELVQVVHDAIASVGRALPGGMGSPDDDHEATMRTLERARERVGADAAIAVVAGGSGPPTFATVGLSQGEAAHVARMGFPDYRGARALQVSFADVPPDLGDDAPVRSGLLLSLLESSERPSMLAVLTRSADRRFSEEDVAALEEIVQDARPTLERVLGLRDPDPVPEHDELTGLFDRHAFGELLARETSRAHELRRPLVLLVLDIDRLASVNARLGHLGGDEVIAQVAERLREAVRGGDFAGRLGGGRFGVVLPEGTAAEAELVFGRLREGLSARPIDRAASLSLSGGLAELARGETPAGLLDRAGAALELAKRSSPGSVVSTAIR